MLTLFPISIVVGILMLVVFRYTSNPKAIEAAKRRLHACLYEMRLFPDEPALVFRAQWGLLTGNARYLGLMLLPAVVLTAPMVILFAYMECFYGMAPLQPGAEAVVTMQLKQPATMPSAPPLLEGPAQIAVETPAVRSLADGQVSWRIRAAAPVSGNLRISMPEGLRIEKSIEAGTGMRFLSDRRVSGLLDWALHPAESRIDAAGVDWIEVRYPPATVAWLGLEWHWLIWLLILSSTTALVLKNRFGVTF